MCEKIIKIRERYISQLLGPDDHLVPFTQPQIRQLSVQIVITQFAALVLQVKRACGERWTCGLFQLDRQDLQCRRRQDGDRLW